MLPLCVGSFAWRRCASRVQTAVASHPQMDDPALLTLQSRLGLDRAFVGYLHGNLYALCRRFPPQRVRFQQQEKPAVRRRSDRHHRPAR